MNKWLIIGLVIVIVVLSAWVGVNVYLNSYIPYVPVVWPRDQHFREAPELNTAEHQQSIKRVLDKYCIPWKMKKGKVMIQRKMMFGDNRDFLLNLTQKALTFD